MRHRPTTKAALSVVLGLATLTALTACAGGSSAESAASATATSPSASAAAGGAASGGPADGFAAYRDCMAQNGVTLQDFGGPQGAPPSGMPTGMPSGAPPSGGPNGPGQMPLPDGVDQEAFDAAQQACASVRPQFDQGGPGAIDQTALAAYSSCLSDNGVTVPSGPDGFRSLDNSDPDVQAAMDTCAPLMPTPGGATPAAS